MKVVEMGELGESVAADVVDAVYSEIERLEDAGSFEWYSYEARDKIRNLFLCEIANRLPVRGYMVSATRDEIVGLPFNAMNGNVTLVSVEKGSGK